jgi:two-component system LytT family response regulator
MSDDSPQQAHKKAQKRVENDAARKTVARAPFLPSGLPVASMHTMNVLIVDDEYLARERMRELAEAEDEVRIAGEAATGPDAVHAIETLKPDLVLLDIALPAMDGFEVLSCVETSPLPLIIFTTAFDQHAIRAFEVQAIDYLLKPVEKDRFSDALQRARTRLTQRADAHDKVRRFANSAAGPRERIVVRHGERILFLKPREIDAIEAVGNYVRIHRGGEHMLLRQTLASLEERLGPHGFARIQRSVLINTERVAELQRESRELYLVVLATGGSFRLSPNYRSELERALGKF